MDNSIQQKLNELSNINSVQYTPEFLELVERLIIEGFNGFWTGFDPHKVSPQRFEDILSAIPKSAYHVAQEYFNRMQKQIYESPTNN